MDEPVAKPKWHSARILKTILGLLAGVLLGSVSYFVFEHGWKASLIVGVLAAFVGIALAQPGVSAANVAKGTAGMFVAHNVPLVGDKLFGGDSNEPEKAPPPDKPKESHEAPWRKKPSE